jgi:sugar phosphate isomerase/epimerase
MVATVTSDPVSLNGFRPSRRLRSLAMSLSGEEGQRLLPRLREYGLGIELTDFIAPTVWHGDYLALARRWAVALGDFPGPRCLHGAFIDLHPAAQEPDLVAFARRRHHQSLEVAAALGCDLLVVHSDFPHRAALPARMTEVAARLTDYFGDLAAAAGHNITVVVENIYDADPRPLAELARAIDAPNLGLSIDVGHATLYGPSFALDEWVLACQPYLRHVHVQDNDGKFDRHWGIGAGTIPFRPFFDAVTLLDPAPRVTIEVVDRREAWQTLELLIAQGWYAPAAQGR